MFNPSFPWRKTIVLGFGSLGVYLLWAVFNSLIPPMLENLGLSALVIGLIMTWDNIINVFFQPWVGARSDRVPSRFGRRKPWLIAGAPVAALFFMLLPFLRDHFLLMALGILGTDIAMALFRSPSGAYLGDLFHPHQRSKANGVLGLMAGAGGALGLFGGGALYKIGIPLPFIFGGGIMFIAMLVVLLTVREPGGAARNVDEASRPLMAQLRQLRAETDRRILLLFSAIFCWFAAIAAFEAFFTLYAKNVLGTSVGTGAQILTAFYLGFILFAIPSGLIATRFGRKRTILAGLSGLAAAMLVGFNVRNPILLLIVLGVGGAFFTLVRINALPLVYDFGNPRDIGVLTGLYEFCWSAAAIVGPILGGALVDMANKNYSALWLFSAAFELIALVLMTGVPTKEGAVLSEYQGSANA